MPELDRKARAVLSDKVVRKDLVRQLKAGAPVPCSWWNISELGDAITGQPGDPR